MGTIPCMYVILYHHDACASTLLDIRQSRVGTSWRGGRASIDRVEHMRVSNLLVLLPSSSILSHADNSYSCRESMVSCQSTFNFFFPTTKLSSSPQIPYVHPNLRKSQWTHVVINPKVFFSLLFAAWDDNPRMTHISLTRRSYR
jgi:hypothetical protein